MLTGALTFFLPCGFTQAMQLYAISTGDFKSGAIVMGAFALGTAPALLGIGGLSSIMKGARARMFYAAVGILVIAFGIYNIKSAMAVLPSATSSNNAEVNYTPIDQGADQGDVQIIKMTQSASGYSPSTLRVKAGIPVRWVITPTEKGSIPYSCSMGMYRGTIIVE